MRHDNFEVDSERFCQLCGISFNAGRIRRPDEPPAAAWGFYGHNFVAQPDSQASCQSRSCQWLERDKYDAGGDALGIVGDEETFGGLEYREHLAGPECTCTEGYTGYEISVQEMQHVISYIDGLWRLREEKGDYASRFEGMPRNPDVDLVTEKWYSARPGTQYLAADPVDVPGLSALIQSCLVESGEVCESVFDASEHMIERAEHSDPFARLPSELQHILLKQISRQDVANLRLVSPAFKQLPQSYFRHLVETQMPWLWEVSDLPKHQIDFYRLWCRLHEADGGSQQDLQEREWLTQTPRKKSDALRDELELPTGFSAEWDKRAPKLEEEAEAEIQAGYESGMWRRKPTNVLLGLRNRKRIWQDLDVIVQMISELALTSDEV
ncbi:hypothetical protein KC331_g1464 [Hortaea werneckii]|nr:hypothetical protein KC331_g1464 [Hortaea werneckii]KAI7721727.1 hypothetical protein KC353_g1142 [Hortaea werneckii]